MAGPSHTVAGETTDNGNYTLRVMPRKTFKTEIAEIFAYWQDVMNHPKARLSADRSRCIAARLREGYTVADIKLAIDGYKVSPFHQGDNPEGKMYDDLTLICRSGSKLEQGHGYLTRRPRGRDTVGRPSSHTAAPSHHTGSGHSGQPGPSTARRQPACLTCGDLGLIDSHPNERGFVKNRTFSPCPDCSK